MKLIDKAEVATEINRVLNSYDPNEITSGRYALVSLRDFLDTLEVKEVDLDLEITLWANAIPEIRLDDIKRLAKHFFELGLKVKEETMG